MNSSQCPLLADECCQNVRKAVRGSRNMAWVARSCITGLISLKLRVSLHWLGWSAIPGLTASDWLVWNWLVRLARKTFLPRKGQLKIAGLLIALGVTGKPRWWSQVVCNPGGHASERTSQSELPTLILSLRARPTPFSFTVIFDCWFHC